MRNATMCIYEIVEVVKNFKGKYLAGTDKISNFVVKNI
jgi:hypothetical protein